MNTTDPFLALQRDTDRLNDNSFDEGAIKSMYDNQLAQLENLIATQRKAQMKMREQCSVAEKKHNKVFIQPYKFICYMHSLIHFTTVNQLNFEDTLYFIYEKEYLNHNIHVTGITASNS